MRYPLLAMGLVALSAAVTPARAEDAITADEFDVPRAVETCDRFGPGYARLNGTNTCIRVGGRVRIDKTFSNRGGATGGRTQLEFETRSD